MRLLNFGSLNIDYTYQVPHFLSPGETCSCTAMAVGCGGKGLNQSIAAAKAGLETWHAGRIGNEGSFLLEALTQAKVRTDFVSVDSGPTGHAIIQVNPSGENCILIYPGANRRLDESTAHCILDQFSPGDFLLLQNETNLVPELIRMGHSRGMSVAFNAAPISNDLLSYPLELVDYLLINETEGYALTGSSSPQEICAILTQRFPSLQLVLTLGELGCIYAHGDERISVSAKQVKAVDTTAAGDTFTGFFLKGIVNGSDPQSALQLATAASALSVTRLGAASSIPSMDEVLSLYPEVSSLSP